MVVPTVVATDLTPHAVCAIQMMDGSAENVDKAASLNSWGHQHPVVTVNRNDPEHNGEFKFTEVFLLTVRIVAVRVTDNLFMPVPSFKSWPKFHAHGVYWFNFGNYTGIWPFLVAIFLCKNVPSQQPAVVAPYVALAESFRELVADCAVENIR